MRITLLSIFFVLMAMPVGAQTGIAFRPVDERPDSQAALMQVLGSREKVRILPQTVVDHGDVQAVEALQEPYGWGLRILLTPAGGGKMRRWTTDHVGSRLALLVDGEVLSAPKVMEPIGEEITVSGSFSEAAARRMARQLGKAREPAVVGIVVVGRDAGFTETAWQRVMLKRFAAGYLKSRLPVTKAPSHGGVSRPAVIVYRLADQRILYASKAGAPAATAADEAFKVAEAAR